MNVFEFVFMGLRGARMPLSNYQGQPIFFVNTASECGYTPQYDGLEKLYRRIYGDADSYRSNVFEKHESMMFNVMINPPSQTQTSRFIYCSSFIQTTTVYEKHAHVCNI